MSANKVTNTRSGLEVNKRAHRTGLHQKPTKKLTNQTVTRQHPTVTHNTATKLATLCTQTQTTLKKININTSNSKVNNKQITCTTTRDNTEPKNKILPCTNSITQGTDLSHQDLHNTQNISHHIPKPKRDHTLQYTPAQSKIDRFQAFTTPNKNVPTVHTPQKENIATGNQENKIKTHTDKPLTKKINKHSKNNTYFHTHSYSPGAPIIRIENSNPNKKDLQLIPKYTIVTGKLTSNLASSKTTTLNISNTQHTDQIPSQCASGPSKSPTKREDKIMAKILLDFVRTQNRCTKETSKIISQYNIDLLDINNPPSHHISLPKPTISKKFIQKVNDSIPETKINRKKTKTNNQNKNNITAHESNKTQTLLKDYLKETTYNQKNKETKDTEKSKLNKNPDDATTIPPIINAKITYADNKNQRSKILKCLKSSETTKIPRPSENKTSAGKDTTPNSRTFKNIEITQINLQHAHESSLTLLQNIEYSIDLSIPHAICVQEPLCNKENSPMDIPNTYYCYNINSENSNPRAAIYASKMLKENSLPHKELSDRDTYTISLPDPTNNKKRIFLCSVYMPYEQAIKTGKFVEIIKKTNQSQQGLIICSDTNAQSTRWGNKRTNKRGIELEDILDEHNLTIHNNLQCPTWTAQGKSSTIDLTITNIYAPNIQDWQCISEASMSDHQYVQFSTNTEMIDTTKMTRPNTNKCDWENYKEELEKLEINPRISNIPQNKNQIDYTIKKLTAFMKEALQNSCPKSKTKIHPKKRIPNTITALDRLIKKKRKPKNKNKEAIDEMNKDFKRGKNTFTKLIKKARNKAWKNYTNKIESTQETARITKILNKKNANPLGTLRKENGEATQNPADTLNLLADGLLGKETSKKDDQPTAYNMGIEEIKKFITPERLKKAISQLKRKKTPGQDGILNEMIINSPEKILNCIMNVFIASIYHEYTPTPWQIANSAIIAKPGKTDYHNIKSYRVISLTSNLLKLLETLVLWHLQDDLKIEQSMNPNQYGFRSGHSTEAIITKVVNKIQTALKHGDHALGIFIDIQGAFDNLPNTSIKKALDDTAAKGKISNWITNMISNRYITLQLAGEKIVRLIPKGCPQGGVLSPFLWNLVVNDLLLVFRGLDNLLAYADDLLILQSGTDKNTILETAKRYLNKINAWCKSKGLEISTVKTQIVFWTRNKTIIKPKSFKCKESDIEVGTTAKYLGVTLDEKLNWKEHINSQTKKCKNIFFACRKAIGKTWGLSPKTVLWIYNAIILPKISYGSAAWGLSLNKTQRNKLKSLQNLILKTALRSASSTPRLANTIVTNSLPLDLYIQQTCLSRAASLIAENHWTIKTQTYRKTHYKTHMETIDGELRRILASQYNNISDKIRPILNINQTYSTKISERRKFKVSTNPLSIKVFTDGSKDENKNTGYGLHIIDEPMNMGYSEMGSLRQINSVFQAEAFSIEASAKKLTLWNTINRDIIFYSDSQATIKSLQKTKITSATIRDCNKALNILAQGNNQISVNWIPGHRGYEGNELADNLAKLGSHSHLQIKHIKIPHKSVISKIKKYYGDCHIRTWNFSDPHYNCAYPINCLLKRCKFNLPALKNSVLKLPTKEIRILQKVLTGHNNLNSHLYRMNMALDPLCEFCNLQSLGIDPAFCPEETAMHILEECPAFSLLRIHYFEEFHTTFGKILDIKTSLPTILGKIAKFFIKIACFSRTPKFTEPISPKR